MAFPTRFRRIWRTRPGSPTRRVGTSARVSQVNSKPFSSARGARVRMALLRVSCRSNSPRLSESFPASILEKSRRSFSRVRRVSADSFTMSRYSRCSSERVVSRANSVMPTMPFMGVRISWLIMARNSLLARLAASADSLALCISASARFRTVISIRLPSISWDGSPPLAIRVAFSSTHTGVPSFRRRQFSKFVSKPCSRRRVVNSSLASGWRYNSSAGRLFSSAAVAKPKMRAQASLQSRICPSRLAR